MGPVVEKFTSAVMIRDSKELPLPDREPHFAQALTPQKLSKIVQELPRTDEPHHSMQLQSGMTRGPEAPKVGYPTNLRYPN